MFGHTSLVRNELLAPHFQVLNTSVLAGSVPCCRAPEVPAQVRLRASRPQTRKRHVAVHTEALDDHRLWLCCGHR